MYQRKCSIYIAILYIIYYILECREDFMHQVYHMSHSHQSDYFILSNKR